MLPSVDVSFPTDIPSSAKNIRNLLYLMKVLAADRVKINQQKIKLFHVEGFEIFSSLNLLENYKCTSTFKHELINFISRCTSVNSSRFQKE